MTPILTLIAHGSRDRRHAATVELLASRVRRLRPGLPVTVAYLDHCQPCVSAVLDDFAATGRHRVIAVPLLLSPAFHARVDLPQVLHRAAVRHPRLAIAQARVLGPAPLLQDALDRRLREAGVWPGEQATGIVLASAGSTDPEANAALADIAKRWQRTGWRAVVPAFASARGPSTEQAIDLLRKRGVSRTAVAPYVLAPGILTDRIRHGGQNAGADVVAQVLGDAPEVARLALHRYDQVRALGSAEALTA